MRNSFKSGLLYCKYTYNRGKLVDYYEATEHSLQRVHHQLQFFIVHQF